MGNYTILSNFSEDATWKNRDDLMTNYDEVWAEVACECGNEFNISLPFTAYQCQCGLIYRVAIALEQFSNKANNKNNFVVTPAYTKAEIDSWYLEDKK